MFAPPTLSSPRGTSAARSSSSPDRGRPLAGPAGIVGSRACGAKPQGRRGVAAPGWNGPLRAYGIPIGIALEVLCGVALIVLRRRDTAARRAAEGRPYA